MAHRGGPCSDQARPGNQLRVGERRLGGRWADRDQSGPGGRVGQLEAKQQLRVMIPLVLRATKNISRRVGQLGSTGTPSRQARISPVRLRADDLDRCNRLKSCERPFRRGGRPAS